ncbi:carcinoembryonic antigen-related cell adhesion molecule 5-like isoform X1 [Gigantopelta aegis]|uniref:carcinoembryonic antigen-related cell adhesion molecule 5-like isoform X1 n=1 Tax=Gigantopelta aegis TaxID=1735272 RepID=UPI001B88C262|nr:carcinoembryonic antigen-related cell adhesion molecule 5-like isoform X1 [Gigantopelta aegis]XP_041373385.1 carcinoembryonic antigen-related cell adhesion molecule 5-like isoform X1 [Gigantopelta aegis]
MFVWVRESRESGFLFFIFVCASTIIIKDTYGLGSIYFSPSTPPTHITEGGTIGVTCKSTSCDSSCSFRWSRPGQQSLDGSQLTVRDIRRSQAGTYTCTVSDSSDIKTKRFGLNVYYGPDSVPFSLSSPHHIKEGNDLTVSCATSCSPSCNYAWTMGRQQKATSSALTIPNISRDQAGTYTCTITNTGTSTTKNKQFQLNVDYGPDSVTFSSTPPEHINEGDSLRVACTAECKPGCSYSWTFGNQQIGTDPVKLIPSIGRDQSGTYTCIVTNTATRDRKRKMFSLDVYYQQQITSLTLNSQPSGVTVTERTVVTLRCVVDSNPVSDIKLFNGSYPIHEVFNSSTTEYSLGQVECLDTGEYRCKGRNRIWHAVSRTVKLDVTCSPKIDHRVPFQGTFHAALLSDATLSVPIIANPPAQCRWFRLQDNGDRRLLGTSRPEVVSAASGIGKFTLRNAQLEDFGSYQVVVSNGGKPGDLVLNLTLTAQGPPSIPSQFKAWSDDPHSMRLSWMEEFNGGAAQLFLVHYRKHKTKESANRTGRYTEKGLHAKHTAVIPQLQPTTRYLVKVLAYNVYGYKDFTVELGVVTAAMPDPLNSAGVGVAIGLAIAVVLALIFGAIFLVYRRIKTGSVNLSSSRKSSMFHIEVENDDPLEKQSTTVDDLETISNLSSSAGTTLEPENEGISNSDSKTQPQQGETSGKQLSRTSNPYAALGTREQNVYEGLGDPNKKGETQDKKLPHESNPYSALGAREENLYEGLGDQNKTDNQPSETPKPDAEPGTPEQNPYDDLEDPSKKDNQPLETPKPDAAPGIPEQNPYDDLEDTNMKGEALENPSQKSNTFASVGNNEETHYEDHQVQL